MKLSLSLLKLPLILIFLNACNDSDRNSYIAPVSSTVVQEEPVVEEPKECEITEDEDNVLIYSSVDGGSTSGDKSGNEATEEDEDDEYSKDGAEDEKDDTKNDVLEPDDDPAVNESPRKYRKLGDVSIIVDCVHYKRVTAISRSKDIFPASSKMMRNSALYKIEMGAYLISDDRLYLDKKSFVFSFMMPDNEVTGRFKLVTPPNVSGTVEVTFVEDENDGFNMKGKIEKAEIYTNRDQNETYILDLEFSTTILEM